MGRRVEVQKYHLYTIIKYKVRIPRQCGRVWSKKRREGNHSGKRVKLGSERGGRGEGVNYQEKGVTTKDMQAEDRGIDLIIEEIKSPRKKKQ